MRAERQVLFWLAAGLVALTAVLALKDVLLPFLCGLVIAYALNPVADQLERWGLPRTLASVLIVAGLVIVLVALVVFLAPILANQLQQLLTTLPGEIDRLKRLIEEWARARLGDYFGTFQANLDKAAAEISNNWGSVAGLLAQSLWSQGRAIIGFLSVLLITPLVVFYLLIDWHRMLEKAKHWLPRDHEPTLTRIALEMNDAIAAFIRGQGLVCLVLGTLYAVGLSLIGIRYGLLIGIVTGIMSFVPFVGWAVGIAASSALAVVQFWPDMVPLLLVIALFAGGQALDAAFLSPKIVGTKIGLHPVWLIFALVVFSTIFGFVGVLVAVPMAAAVAVLVRFALEIYMSSPIYRGSGSVPRLEAGEK